MSKINEHDWDHVISLYKDEENRVAVRVHREFNADPILLAGLCTALFESFISSINDSHQIEFEEKSKKLFLEMLEERQGYIENE